MVEISKWEWGEAFNLLRQDQTPIDTTVRNKIYERSIEMNWL